MNADSKAILAVIAEMLDRPIAFHPVLAKISGSVTAGLMLSQAVYWSNCRSGNTKDAAPPQSPITGLTSKS